MYKSLQSLQLIFKPNLLLVLYMRVRTLNLQKISNNTNQISLSIINCAYGTVNKLHDTLFKVPLKS